MNKVILKNGSKHLAIDDKNVTQLCTVAGKKGNLYNELKDEFLFGRSQLKKLGEYLQETLGMHNTFITWKYVKTGMVVTVGDESYLLVYFGGEVHYNYSDTFYFTHYILPLIETFNQYLLTKVTYSDEFIQSVETRFMDGFVSQYKLHKLLIWLEEGVYVSELYEFIMSMAYVFGDIVGSDYVIRNTQYYTQITYPGYMEDSIYIFNGEYEDGLSDVDIKQVNHRCKITDDMDMLGSTTKIINVFIGHYLMGVKLKKDNELPKNRVSYSLGKPIILPHREKIEYHKEVQDIVETVLNDFSPYARTNYKYSNTTSSVYLEIKFKNCPNMYISIRDHDGLKENKYDAIYVKNRDLSKLGSTLKEMVTEHIKNTKYM